jgi:hypothetical protein
MPRYIVKLKDKYAMWSTIVDAPVSHFMPLADFMRIFSDVATQDRMDRVEKTGTSALDQTLEDVISFNRAGEDESGLSPEELLLAYATEEN